MGGYEVKNVISFGEICDMLLQPSCVGFTKEVKELRRSSLGGQADLRSANVSCYKSRFHKEGCDVLERLDDLG